MQIYQNNIGYAGKTTDGEEVYIVKCPECKNDMQLTGMNATAGCTCGYNWTMVVSAMGLKED